MKDKEIHDLVKRLSYDTSSPIKAPPPPQILVDDTLISQIVEKAQWCAAANRLTSPSNLTSALHDLRLLVMKAENIAYDTYF